MGFATPPAAIPIGGGPIVVRVVKVVQSMHVAAAVRRVIGRGHATVPLAKPRPEVARPCKDGVSVRRAATRSRTPTQLQYEPHVDSLQHRYDIRAATHGKLARLVPTETPFLPHTLEPSAKHVRLISTRRHLDCETCHIPRDPGHARHRVCRVVDLRSSVKGVDMVAARPRINLFEENSFWQAIFLDSPGNAS